MRVLDLFSGIGGFSLGLERAGMRTVGFCEIEPYCRAVLRKHWPDIWIHDDIKTLTAELITKHCGPVDAICGGFPCQDISAAGSMRGIECGKRSGLWSEMFRLVCEVRPRYVIVENVAALLLRGIRRVLGDLASIGYNSEWQIIPAAAVGAPHLRERIFVIAYPIGDNGRIRANGTHQNCFAAVEMLLPGRSSMPVDVSDGIEMEWKRNCSGFWADYTRMDRMGNGIPDRLDRIKALGNSVVPQVVELIGRAIMEQ